jgi:hypothetical protein
MRPTMGGGMTMSAERALRWALYAGCLYFLGICICHATGWKIPPFFIYFNVESTAYQDWIISVLAFGWSSFFFVASKQTVAQTNLMQAIFISGLVAVVGLARLNLLTDFKSYGLTGSVNVYWIELAGLVLYLAVLFFLHQRTSQR